MQTNCTQANVGTTDWVGDIQLQICQYHYRPRKYPNDLANARAIALSMNLQKSEPYHSGEKHGNLR